MQTKPALLVGTMLALGVLALAVLGAGNAMAFVPVPSVALLECGTQAPPPPPPPPPSSPTLAQLVVTGLSNVCPDAVTIKAGDSCAADLQALMSACHCVLPSPVGTQLFSTTPLTGPPPGTQVLFSLLCFVSES